DPLRRAGDGQRSGQRRPVPRRRPVSVRQRAEYPNALARPDRGGDLRTQYRTGARRRRPVRGPRRRSAAGLGVATGSGGRRRGAQRRRRDPGARRGVARLTATPPLLLMIGRPVDPKILGYMSRTEQAVSEYQRLDQNRSWLQIAFAWI